MSKLMVVDGNSIINRAFYGLQAGGRLTAADGTPTNAVYGFLTILLKHLEDIKPDYLAIAFDLKAPTFRHKLYDQYKANRTGMPDELAVQMPILKEVLDAMNIKRIEIEGYEADDILGTLSKIGETEKHETILLTGDRDSLQLVSDSTVVYLPHTKGGKTTTTIYDMALVKKNYLLVPHQLIDVKALMGDSSDNIPGVKGVGEKTALTLIEKYSTLDDVYANIDEITQKALKEKLIRDKDQAYMSRKLAIINREVPGLDSVEPYKREEINKEALYNLFSKLGFKSLISRLDLGPVVATGVEKISEKNVDFKVPPHFEIKDLIDLSNAISHIKSKKYVYIYPITAKTNSGYRLDALGLATDERCWTVICNELMLPEREILNYLKALATDSTIKKTTYEGKSLIGCLLQEKCAPDGFDYDVLIGAYVVDPNLGGRTIEELAEAFCGINANTIALSYGTMASTLGVLKAAITAKLEEIGQYKLFAEIEMPLQMVLAKMEYEGFKIDIEKLKEYNEKLTGRIGELESEIYSLAGHDFNIASPKQLGVVLFEELGLPIIKKTKTGYSTDVSVLEQLQGLNPIIDHIMEYRTLTKLKSTYADGLESAMEKKTHKLHTCFKQTGTNTGRLSSTEPNLQNIPVRVDLGREIRKVFIPSNPDYVLIDADYSQIELRVLAHVANDKNMIDAFNEGLDIHTATAMKVFGISKEEVDATYRRRAKAVNFGIVYGISSFGLARDLGISRGEAKEFIDSYLTIYSGVDKYMREVVQNAKQNGYVETIFGRRRYVPELAASNKNMVAFGERIAMNAPIQGSAADIIKIAMIKVAKVIDESKIRAKLILQVHDELILEVHKEDAEQAKSLLQEAMEQAVEMKVKLIAEANAADCWYDAK